MPTTTLKITGMHCTSCKALIEDVASEIPGVQSCAVDVPAGTATVEHDATLDMQRLIDEIRSLNGYDVSL
jgi:copper chaperone CopZ